MHMLRNCSCLKYTDLENKKQVLKLQNWKYLYRILKQNSELHHILLQQNISANFKRSHLEIYYFENTNKLNPK